MQTSSGMRLGSDGASECGRVWPVVFGFLVLFFSVILALGGPAAAQERIIAFPAKGSVEPVQLAPSTTEAITLNVQYANLVVGDTNIADALPLTGHSLYIQAKAVGHTNIAIYDVNKEILGILDVKIATDLSDLRRALQAALPRSAITITQLNGRVELSGHVPDAIALRSAIDITTQFVGGEGNIVNALRVTDSQQVLLEVRFLEAARSASRELGVGFAGANSSGNGIVTGGGVQSPVTPGPGGAGPLAPLLSGATPFGTALARVLGGGLPIDMVIKALETKGLVRRLAEPNLTAMSGQSAYFNAGGEIPYCTLTTGAPVSTATTCAVTLTNYGVQLEFTPTVLDDGVINLVLHPKVSEIDPTLSVNGNPALISRETRTTIELHDGQSFSVSGLLQANNTKSIQQLPGVGQIPVLGALFRSASYQKNETDLVIIITVHLVRPAVPGEVLHTPLDKTRPSNDAEEFLLGLMEVNKDTINGFATCEGVHGPCGHIIDIPKARGAAYVSKK